MTEIVSAIYDLMGRIVDPAADEEIVRDKVERLFQVNGSDFLVTYKIAQAWDTSQWCRQIKYLCPSYTSTSLLCWRRQRPHKVFVCKILVILVTARRQCIICHTIDSVASDLQHCDFVVEVLTHTLQLIILSTENGSKSRRRIDTRRIPPVLRPRWSNHAVHGGVRQQLLTACGWRG